MAEKIRILFLSANPWTTARILVDEEERAIFEKLQEGPYRKSFELHRHPATRVVDLQRLLMTHQPQIVHFSGHGSKKQRLILGGTRGRGKEIEHRALVQTFALYSPHVRLVVLNACFTRIQAESLAEVIDYAIGAGKGIGDKAGVVFAGAFYRALGFGMSVRRAFESAKAEIDLIKMPRARGFELFARNEATEFEPLSRAPRKFRSNSDLREFVLDPISVQGQSYPGRRNSNHTVEPGNQITKTEDALKSRGSQSSERTRSEQHGRTGASVVGVKETSRRAKGLSLVAPEHAIISETYSPEREALTTARSIVKDLLPCLSNFKLRLRSEITIEVESEVIRRDEEARVAPRGKEPRTSANFSNKKTRSKYSVRFKTRSRPV